MLGFDLRLARLFLGLGATTNLSDAYPWGLWVSFDILAGVALAGGGFTMAAAIYIFNLKKFEPLLRPAKLSAFLGYMMFVVGLFFDLGQPWRIWHPMVMWNPHSVLFEVSWCVMLYTTVLSLDLFIIGLERYGKQSWIKFFRDIYLVLVVAGIMLSTLHQSSLGALFLLMPQKMSDLWASRGHRAAVFHQRGHRRHERHHPGEPDQRPGLQAEAGNGHPAGLSARAWASSCWSTSP